MGGGKGEGVLLNILPMFIMSLLFLSPAHAEMVDKIVAKVGDEVITLSDVGQSVAERRTYLFTTYKDGEARSLFERFKENALQELILQKILIAEVKKEGIAIAESLIDQEYNRQLQESGVSEVAFINKLKQQGVTIADFKNQIKMELARQQFIQKKILPNIAISDYDLQREYEKNKDHYATYQKFRFVEVYLEEGKFDDVEEMQTMAAAIQSRLKSSLTAADLIKKHSSGAFADRGGDSGSVLGSSLRPEIRNILSQLKNGEVTNPIPIAGGVFIFKLLEKSDPLALPYNEVVTRLRLKLSERLVAQSLKKYLNNVRDQMYVEVMP